LVIAESEDGGTTWSKKYTTSETVRGSQPALSILDDGTIGFLYDAYDPSTNELSQHFVTTSNDFASTNNFTLGTETNNAFPTATESPYLGDFFDLSSAGDTFYGIFSALNFDNGDPTTGAALTNVSFQRDFTGSAGTSNFQLTNSSGRAVSESVDPFAFTLFGAGTTTQLVSSGVVSSGAAVTSGNVLEVLSGGSANATSVGSSGTEQVDAGAHASGTIVSGGGTEVVYGSETGAAVRGGTLEVISGGVASGTTVSSGATLEVWSSGTAINTTVLSGGTLAYFSGANANAVTFSAGATLEAASGYVASGLTVSSALTLAVGAQGSAVSNTILGGGAISILFGGQTSGTIVSSGGVESISFLGSASGTTVDSGGVQDILSGGVASSTVVQAGGSETVGPSGKAVDATVASGGSLIVSSGGSLELVGSDTLSGVTLLPGAIVLVGSGYTLSGYVVNNGITLGVLSGGIASNTTVLSGGAFEYFGGGTDSGTVLDSGAVRIIGYNRFETSRSVDASSPLEVAFGGQANDTRISSGGIESVLAGGVDSGGEVHASGTQIVYAGGTASSAQVDSGGLLSLSGGTAVDATIDGKENVFSGGLDSDATINDGGSASVASGGLIIYGLLSGTLSVLSGGLAVSKTIATGGLENVSSGGLDSGTRISTGGIEVDSSGGMTSSAVIDSGGLLGLFGGTAIWTTISSGGFESVSSGGLDSAAIMSLGGSELVQSGGVASGAILSGGVLTVSAGAAVDTTIDNTAEEIVLAGGTIDGVTSVNGGTLDGGANAILDHLRALQTAGFEVSFLTLGSMNGNAIALSSLGVTLLSMPQSGLFSDFARAHADQFDLVYLHRVETATRCLKLARRYFDAQIIYSVADLHHLRLKGQSEFEPDHAAELVHQACDVALQELGAAVSADWVIAHSVSEAEQLQQMSAIAGKVRVIPWALRPTPVETRFADRSGVAFIGSFAHAPNVDAARWLVHEIMPLVWRKAPEIQCLIIGSGLSDDLRRELTKPGINVLGRVDDLAAVLERIRLTLAPLRFGAGLKDKVLRSLAAGLPCVGTPEAFNGMKALPAAITNMCQGNTPSELAAAVVRLHQHERANTACAQIGLSYIGAFYNQSRIDELMQEIARPALDRQRAARPKPGYQVLNFGERFRPREGAITTNAEQPERRIQFK
jgi:autotransporter passenger strand-loop-strand repeat protein